MPFLTADTQTVKTTQNITAPRRPVRNKPFKLTSKDYFVIYITCSIFRKCIESFFYSYSKITNIDLAMEKNIDLISFMPSKAIFLYLTLYGQK